jgi:formylmethanofuran dehydrogenase subunit C
MRGRGGASSRLASGLGRWLVLALACAGLVFTAGCVRAGETMQESRTIARGNAQEVVARLEMDSGDLVVEGGAEELMEADFRYNVDRWEPEVDYRLDGTTGRLTVTQPGAGPFAWIVGGTTNAWYVRFSDEVPIAVRVDVSSVPVNADFSELDLVAFETDVDSGDTLAILDQAHPSLEDVDLDSSSGEVDLQLTGEYERLANVDVRTSSGDVVIDLRGTWDSDTRVRVRVSSGDVTVFVPIGVDVSAEAGTESGNVRAEGLEGSGGRYSLAGDGRVDGSLEVDVETSSGDIILEVAR